jgi:lipopolysaccharide transport system permease protein
MCTCDNARVAAVSERSARQGERMIRSNTLMESSRVPDVQNPLPVDVGYQYQKITQTIWNSSYLGAWLTELWDYRSLFYFFVWRDIKVRYKQTLLGAMWAVIQPFLSMILLSFFFGKLAGIATEGGLYPIFSYSALVPWTFFSTALSSSSNSMVSNANLFTKIYFPRIAVPITPVLAGLIDFAIASLLLFVLMPYYGVPVTSALLLWPVLMLPLLCLAIGLGLIMASLSVRYRDVKYALPFLIQMMMFATPIIYPLAVVPASYRWLSIINPLTGIIDAFRAAVLHPESLDFVSLGISLAETCLILVLGLFYFRKTERIIADVI